MLRCVGSTKACQSILLVIFSLQHSAFADVNSSVTAHWNTSENNVGINLRMKSSLHKNWQISGTISPVQPCNQKFSFLPEYFISFKDEGIGKLTIGKHMSAPDMLLVDGGSLIRLDTVGDLENSHYFNHRSIYNNKEYDFKYSCLSNPINEKLYFGLSYTPSKEISQARLMYADTVTSALDFKTSIGITNSKINGGLNIQYLGLMLGGSVGIDYHTIGIGYSIGPFKSAISYLNTSDLQSTIFTLQYRINRYLLPQIQWLSEVGKHDKSSKVNEFVIGLKIST